MRHLARESKVNPVIIETARNLTQHLPQKDWVGQIKALHKFVRDNIRYLKDINNVETIQYPVRLLETKSGDCDDKATLLASLLESIGHPARFAALGFRPGVLEHVIVETLIGRGKNKKWLPLETTEPVHAGWFPKGVKSKMVKHI